MLGAVLVIPPTAIKGFVIPIPWNIDESIYLYIISKGEIRLEMIPKFTRLWFCSMDPITFMTPPIRPKIYIEITNIPLLKVLNEALALLFSFRDDIKYMKTQSIDFFIMLSSKLKCLEEFLPLGINVRVRHPTETGVILNKN
jgi:hypothetical protein